MYRAESLEDGIGKTFPVFTAIITVDKGVVTVIRRDVCLCVCIHTYVHTYASTIDHRC